MSLAAIAASLQSGKNSTLIFPNDSTVPKLALPVLPHAPGRTYPPTTRGTIPPFVPPLAVYHPKTDRVLPVGGRIPQPQKSGGIKSSSFQDHSALMMRGKREHTTMRSPGLVGRQLPVG